MTDRDLLIWMAGFFDGEGCVNIGRQQIKNRPKAKREYWSYQLGMFVANRHEAPCRLFYDTFGGHIYTYTQKGISYWRWSLWGSRAMTALEKLLPYLRLKRPVAEVGIRFQVFILDAYSKLHRRKDGYPDDVVIARDALFEEARVLNAKGRTNNRAPAYEGPKVLALKRAVNQEQ